MSDDAFIKRWKNWVDLKGDVVICKSEHAQRRWNSVLEAEARKLYPPRTVRYEVV